MNLALGYLDLLKAPPMPARQAPKIENARNVPLISSYYTAGVGITEEKSWNQLVDAYKSWVYTAIARISLTWAMIPLKLYVYRRAAGSKAVQGDKVVNLSWRPTYKAIREEAERKYFLKDMGLQREEVLDHPFLTLLQRPNAFMTRFQLWCNIAIRLELGGQCGLLKMMNGLKVPQEIWTLPITKYGKITPKISPRLELEYWEYQDGNRQRFKPDEVFMINYVHPASPFQGMSPLMAQTYPYDIDLFLMQQQRSLFEHGAMPGLHLGTEQKFTRDQVDEMRGMINEQFAGALKSGETLITHSGLKAERLGWTGREAMINVVEEYARDKLITAFGEAPGTLGLIKDVNRNNGEFLNELFIQQCLRPRCMMVEEEFETFFLPLYDEGLTCDFDLPYTGDKQFELNAMMARLQNYVTVINEERERLGMKPRPDGDKPWMPFTLAQPGGSAPVDEGKEFKSKDDSLKIMDLAYWTDERKDIHWKTFIGKSEKLKELFLAPMRAYFKNQADEVVRRLDKEGKKILGQYAGWSHQRVEEHLKQNKAVSDINIDKKVEEEKLRNIFTPVAKHIMKEFGDSRVRDLTQTIKAVAIDFNVNDPAVLKWIGARMRRFSREVTGTTFDAIEAILREGFSEGQPVAVIGDTLRQKFESWDKYRAPLISRTETLASMNQADLDSVRQTGVDEKLLKHWLSSRDDHCRDTHLKADERYSKEGIPMDKEFEVGADRMLAPGGGSLAEEVVNCRCVMIFSQIEEEE